MSLFKTAKEIGFSFQRNSESGHCTNESNRLLIQPDIYRYQRCYPTTRRFPSASSHAALTCVMIPYSLPPSTNSAAAPPIASLPVSFTLVWKMTLLPSFHISVTSVWPGSTVPAKRTLIFLNGPNLFSLSVTLFHSNREESYFS